MTPRTPRVVFLDLLRLVASVQMIQGHTVDGLLATELRHGAVFDSWTFLRGLTAPSFLVASGLAFHSAVIAGPPAARGGPGRTRRLRRAAMLVALGYLLHLPLGAILQPHAPGAADAWAAFAICDVLQVIGVTLAAIELACVVLPRPWPVALAILVAAYVAAPFCAGIEPHGALRVVENLVSRRGGSVFPLTPYAGHLCAGVLLGAFALPEGTATPRRTTVVRLAIAAAVVLALAAIAFAVLPPADSAVDLSWTLLKLGLVLVLALALAVLSLGVERLPTRLETLAGETLLLYTSHLLAIYASTVGLAAILGPTLGLAPTLGMVAVMIAFSIAFATGWRQAARRLARPRQRR